MLETDISFFWCLTSCTTILEERDEESTFRAFLFIRRLNLEECPDNQI